MSKLFSEQTCLKHETLKLKYIDHPVYTRDFMIPIMIGNLLSLGICVVILLNPVVVRCLMTDKKRLGVIDLNMNIAHRVLDAFHP